MKCIIPGPNIKVLGRAIHSLARFGEDLYVESTENELFFRTVNLSKTAYASYSFSSDFFSYFSCERNSRNGSVTCQISMRSALSIFRSPLTLDRTTESIQIQFQPKSDKIIYIVKYKKGVIKTFNVPVIECEALEAYYHKDSSLNSITIQPKIVGEILTNFQNNQDEITWKVTRNNMLIKNYSEPEDEYKGIRTEICVNKDEFDDFKITYETEVTFCLKELRGVLLFSDSVSLPLTANFSICSKPIVFVIKNDIFEVNIVVSTLSGTCNSNVECSFPSKADSVQNNKNDTACRSQEMNENLLQEQSIAKSNGENARKDKLKQVFQRCFDKEMQDVKNLPGYNIVLASDSDSDSYQVVQSKDISAQNSFAIPEDLSNFLPKPCHPFARQRQPTQTEEIQLSVLVQDKVCSHLLHHCYNIPPDSLLKPFESFLLKSKQALIHKPLVTYVAEERNVVGIVLVDSQWR